MNNNAKHCGKNKNKSGSLGVMGVSTPYSIGAKLAMPEKTVISIGNLEFFFRISYISLNNYLKLRCNCADPFFRLKFDHVLESKT